MADTCLLLVTAQAGNVRWRTIFLMIAAYPSFCLPDGLKGASTRNMIGILMALFWIQILPFQESKFI